MADQVTNATNNAGDVVTIDGVVVHAGDVVAFHPGKSPDTTVIYFRGGGACSVNAKVLAVREILGW